MALPSALKEELVRSLDDLSPAAATEVQQFIEFLKFKSNAPGRPGSLAIGGWLKNHRFTNEDIAQARAEMWGRFEDSAA